MKRVVAFTIACLALLIGPAVSSANAQARQVKGSLTINIWESNYDNPVVWSIGDLTSDPYTIPDGYELILQDVTAVHSIVSGSAKKVPPAFLTLFGGGGDDNFTYYFSIDAETHQYLQFPPQRTLKSGGHAGALVNPSSNQKGHKYSQVYIAINGMLIPSADVE